MADAYGSVVVTWKDCEPDKAAVAVILNQFVFNDADDSSFDSNLKLAPGPEPLARPLMSGAMFEDGKGGYYFLNLDDIQEKYSEHGEDWEDAMHEDPACYGTCQDRVPLSRLADVADYLGGSGWLEIAASANESGSDVYFETVRIYADKRVEYSRKRVSRANGVEEEREDWSPLIGFVNGEG